MAKSLAHNSVISGLAAIATNMAGFLSTVIVARLVGVEGTGVVSFSAAIATITIAVFDLGIQTTLTRFVPELEATGDDDQMRALVWHLLRIFVAANLVLFLSLLGIGIYCYVTDPSTLSWVTAENFRGNPLFWAMTAAFCLVQALAFFETAYLKGRQRFRELTLISDHLDDRSALCRVRGDLVLWHCRRPARNLFRPGLPGRQGVAPSSSLDKAPRRPCAIACCASAASRSPHRSFRH